MDNQYAEAGKNGYSGSLVPCNGSWNVDQRDYEDFLSRLEKALEMSKVSPEELVKQVIMGTIRPEDIFSRSQVRQVVKARALYCYLAKERGRMNGGQLMRQLRLTSGAISHLAIRGRELYEANKL